jgi:hypothetical protein
MTLALLLLHFAAGSDLESLLKQISESGRVTELCVASEERIQPVEKLAPGAPPLLTFRLLEGQQTHRFGNLDLVLDDAGH